MEQTNLTTAVIRRLRDSLENDQLFTIPTGKSDQFIDYLSLESTYPIGQFKNFKEINKSGLLEFKDAIKQKKQERAKSQRSASEISHPKIQTTTINAGGKTLEIYKPASDSSPYVELTEKGFKQIGGLADVIQGKIERFAGRHVPTQISMWRTNDEIRDKLVEHMPRLKEISPRFSSLYVDVDYNQVNMGVYGSSRETRESVGLPASVPADKQTVGGETFDHLYNECVRAVAKLWLTGLKIKYPTKQDLVEGYTTCSLRKSVMKGHISEGSRDVEDLIVMLEVMETNELGTFMYATTRDLIAAGYRRQAPGGEEGEGTVLFIPKLRGATLLNDTPDGGFYIGYNADLGDGHMGMRLRFVANHSTAKNLPRVQANAMYLDAWTPKLERLHTQKIDKLNERFIGSLSYAADVSKYDGTSLREDRTFILEIIASQQMIELQEHVEHDDIVIAYEHLNEDGSLTTKRVLIPRGSSDVAYRMIEMLSSGDGYTSIFGKIQNMSDQVRSWCLSLDMTPIDFVQPDYPGDDDLICHCLVNGGDDRGDFTKFAAEAFGLDENKLLEIFVKHTTSSPFFKVTEEVPAKTTGIKQTKDGNGRVLYFTGDEVTLIANNLGKEWGIDHPNRSDPILGLSGSILAYKEKSQGTPHYDVICEVTDILLDIVGWEHGESALHDEATAILEAEFDLVDEDGRPIVTEANAPHLAADILGLTDPSKLYYMFTREQLKEALPDDIYCALWVEVPKRLGEDLTRFVNVENVLSINVATSFNYSSKSVNDYFSGLEGRRRLEAANNSDYMEKNNDLMMQA